MSAVEWCVRVVDGGRAMTAAFEDEAAAREAFAKVGGVLLTRTEVIIEVAPVIP